MYTKLRAGPAMKSIKASPQEYDELGFNPKDRLPDHLPGVTPSTVTKSQELVKQIAESYLFLVRANKDEVMDGNGEEI